MVNCSVLLFWLYNLLEIWSLYISKSKAKTSLWSIEQLSKKNKAKKIFCKFHIFQLDFSVCSPGNQTMAVTKCIQRNVHGALEEALTNHVTGNHKHCTLEYQNSSPRVWIKAQFFPRIIFFLELISDLNLQFWERVFEVFSGHCHTAFKSLQWI